jgi:hypothetical protein
MCRAAPQGQVRFFLDFEIAGSDPRITWLCLEILNQSAV